MLTALTLLLLAFASLADAQQLTFTPYRNNGIYALGEKAGWTVAAPKDAPPAKYTYEIKKNNFATIKTGTLDFSSGSATIEATLQEPAMLYVTVTGAGAAPIHLGAAIAPAQLQPSAPPPTDFDAFWLNKIQYLSITPMVAVVNPMKTAQAGVELSAVQADSFGSRMRGYMAKPIKLGRFPALILYADSDVTLLDPKTATDRAAEGWLTFAVAPHDVMLNQPTTLPPNFAQMGNANRETAYLLYMYLRDARAVDYICSSYDWDGKTIVLMGNGMGGQQALVAAGLRQQVSAVIAGEPTGADIAGERSGRKPGFPNWLSADPRAMTAAPYFDIVNFTGRIRGSVLASVDFTSTDAPPAGIYIALNQVHGPHEVIADSTAFRARAKALLDSMLHGSPLK
jgi:cephalosporin-C deacetylase-like acetyl esterase